MYNKRKLNFEYWFITKALLLEALLLEVLQRKMSGKQYKAKLDSAKILELYSKWQAVEAKTKDKSTVPPFFKCASELPDQTLTASKDKDGNATYYFDYFILTNPGEPQPKYETFHYDFGQQIACSNPKLPPKTTLQAAKHLNIKFYDISDGKIFENSIYKKKEKQDALIASSRQMTKALMIIHEEFGKCADRIRSDPSLYLKFGIPRPKKDPKPSMPEHSFCQTERKANSKDNAEEAYVPLDKPMFSARIKVNPADKTFSFQYKKDAAATPLLYDLRKILKSEKKNDIPCTYVDKQGLPRFPHIENINDFLNYRTSVMGQSQFEGVYSSQGLSIHWNMKKLYVFTHPRSEPTLEQSKMEAFLDGMDDEALAEIDEPTQQSAPAMISNKKQTLVVDEDADAAIEPNETEETKRPAKSEGPNKKNQMPLDNDDEVPEHDIVDVDDTNTAEDSEEEQEKPEPQKPVTKKKVGVPSPQEPVVAAPAPAKTSKKKTAKA